MKIRLWSDVHLEFGPLDVQKRDDDKETVLVIAGDFDVGCKSSTKTIMMELCRQFKAVVFVCGNHEYYHQVLNEVDQDWRSFADDVPNFYFLQGDYSIIDDVRFIGGTFWTDFCAADPRVMDFCKSQMNDYNCIRYQGKGDAVYRWFEPKDAWQINQEQRAAFTRILETPFSGRTVIVTHHAPTEHSIDLLYNHHSSDRILNFAYHNTRLGEWFEENKNFTHWFHGHIHRRQQHEVNGKLIIANPRGYDGYEAMADTFEDDKVFEL